MKRLLVPLLCVSVLHANVELINNGKGHDWRKSVFSYIYNSKHWFDGESLSGPGSSLSSTSTVSVLLPSVLKALGVRTMIDAGCGDFNWMKTIVHHLDLDFYLGVDIVQSVIEENQSRYGSEKLFFMNLDLVDDPLPQMDVIMCRDVLAHLSYEDIYAVLHNFKKSGATYLLISSYSGLKDNNIEMIRGNFRPVNFQAKPFYFPEPLMSVFELASEEKMVKAGKRICVWRIADLPLE